MSFQSRKDLVTLSSRTRRQRHSRDLAARHQCRRFGGILRRATGIVPCGGGVAPLDYVGWEPEGRGGPIGASDLVAVCSQLRDGGLLARRAPCHALWDRGLRSIARAHSTIPRNVTQIALGNRGEAMRPMPPHRQGSSMQRCGEIGRRRGLDEGAQVGVQPRVVERPPRAAATPEPARPAAPSCGSAIARCARSPSIARTVPGGP